MAEAGRVLITFDVDGTLMQSLGENANLLHKRAFSYAFEEVFGIVGTIDAIKHHGSTDPLVLINTLEYYGISTDTATVRLPELKEKMLEYARKNADQVGEGLELLPGVKELLQALAERKNDVVVGLVTGNLEEIAWLKMEGLGIKSYFSVPNFGGLVALSNCLKFHSRFLHLSRTRFNANNPITMPEFTLNGRCDLNVAHVLGNLVKARRQLVGGKIVFVICSRLCARILDSLLSVEVYIFEP